MNVHKVIESPIGGLTLVAGQHGLNGLYHEHHQPEPSPAVLGDIFDPCAVGNQSRLLGGIFGETEKQLGGYFTGELQVFTLKTDRHGTDFQCKVWDLLTEIPYGQTRSYKDIAALLGNPAMGRAIGAALSANPLSIIIPGHRILSSAGGVTGYSAGTEVKKFLLDTEARAGQTTAA